MSRWDLPRVHLRTRIDGASLHGHVPTIVAALPPSLRRQRWFGGKSRSISRVSARDWVVLPFESAFAVLLVADVFEDDDQSATYWTPLIVRSLDDEPAPEARAGGAALLIVEAVNGRFAVSDAMADERFIRGLLARIAAESTERGERGAFGFRRTAAFDDLVHGTAGQPGHAGTPHVVRQLRVEQSNTSVVVDDRVILKTFRRLASGINPEVEVTEFLTTRTTFRSAPLVAGAIEYRETSGARYDVGVLQQFVPNDGDGWSDLLATLRQVIANRTTGKRSRPPNAAGEPDRLDDDPLGRSIVAQVRELGVVTARLHVALASVPDTPAFRPEPLGDDDVNVVVSGLVAVLRGGLRRLAAARAALPATSHSKVDLLLSRERDLHAHVVRLSRRLHESGRAGRRLGQRIRCHGDFHLGQVLRTGNSYVVVDFEGEPARTLQERRAKTSPLRDVAGMARSFHYLVAAASRPASPGARSLNPPEPSIQTWGQTLERVFLDEYCRTVGRSAPATLPDQSDDVEALFDLFSLEKALYELGYELDNRPDWVDIPLEWLANHPGARADLGTTTTPADEPT